jgi:homocysteine S-methyltransferase
VRLETTATIDPILDVASLATSGNGHVLRAVAGEYAAIASAVGFPIELDAMTYWASPDHLRDAGRLDELAAINRACVAALQPIRDSARTFVAGVIGPRADGYRAGASMDVEEAIGYHTAQAQALAASHVDVILGSTMSSAQEATGLASAISATGTDYIIGYVVDERGRLPDGTPLPDVVRRIDGLGDDRPVHHLITCAHPRVALSAMRHLRGNGDDVSDRVIGIKANGANASPDTLEMTRQVLSDPPLEWIQPMLELRAEFGFRVLGGCCGTDGRHILALALALASTLETSNAAANHHDG